VLLQQVFEARGTIDRSFRGGGSGDGGGGVVVVRTAVAAAVVLIVVADTGRIAVGAPFSGVSTLLRENPQPAEGVDTMVIRVSSR